MLFGCQIEAPDGFGAIRKNVRYYFAGRNSARGALLIYFYRGKGKNWRVGFVHMATDVFEHALQSSPADLKPCSKQYSLPPDLTEIEGMTFSEFPPQPNKKKGAPNTEEGKVHNGPKHTAETRLMSIFPLLDCEDEILSADDPLRQIGKIAKKESMTQHLHRLQYWFFIYVLHGRNLWALRPATHRNGTWSRTSDIHAKKKFGRKSAHGSKHGWPSHLMKEAAIKGYLKYCDQGRSMQSIYTTCLSEVFDCITEEDELGRIWYVQRENTPYPTYHQFRHQIVKKYGLDEVQKALYGEARMRRVARVNDGNFTEQIGNWMEYIEVDAYRVDARAISYLSDSAASSLIVARAICRGTSHRLGIGFSVAGESQEAYKSMMFSMAVSKEVVARLYGIPENTLKWESEGVPRAMLSDRGPAGMPSLLDELEDKLAIKSITPSYSGQSKPVIETSNPRSTDIEGEPTYEQSDLTLAEMMKAEILRTAAENHQTNIIEKLPPAALIDFRKLGYPATPHFFKKYLVERGRTSAQAMDFGAAVRAFWTREEVSLTPDGVMFKTITYSSRDFRESGMHLRLIKSGLTKVYGYHLSLVKTFIYIDVDGKLIELEACRKFKFDLEEINLPISALNDLEEAKKFINSMTRETGQAARSEYARNLKMLTGKTILDGERRSARGKSKKAESTGEANVLRGRAIRRSA